MEMLFNIEFSGAVTTFHGIPLPEEAKPVGYAAIIDAYKLSVPFPYKLSCIGFSHKRMESGRWSFYTPRHSPETTLTGNLIFALKYEGVDLSVLKSLFLKIDKIQLENYIRSKPTGSYARRLWFLYEWLLDKKLALSDIKSGNYVSVLDPEIQIALPGVNVARQRVVNNLPGTRGFCPLVFKTPRLKDFIKLDLKAKAVRTIAQIPMDVMPRTAAFLLLKDSKASYAIENEAPAHSRIERWGRVLSRAGNTKIDLDELVELQKTVIGDLRFVKPGLRTVGGFVGEHDRDTGHPIPEHISARPEDLPDLLSALLSYTEITNGQLDPIIPAGVLAFGFVNIHPFIDGNGRIHRFLIHHVLAQNGFNPPGFVFPVSAVMLDRIEEYRTVLQGYSKPLLEFIQWEPTDDNNVSVLNETADYYRYFDATLHVEFLYSCIQRTVEYDLKEEALFLERYDLFLTELSMIVDMPKQTADLLFRFLRQNNGRLSRRARNKEFKALTEEEIKQIEQSFEMIMKD